jgi:hypothetical protein
VNEVSNIEAKATPKKEQYNSESQQNDSRRDSNHSRHIDHTADGDVLIFHAELFTISQQAAR